MNIMDLVDTLGVTIKWERLPNDKGWVTCWLDGCSMRAEPGKSWNRFITGRGKNARDALTSLTDNIKGVRIAYDVDFEDGVFKGKRGMFVPKAIEPS